MAKRKKGRRPPVEVVFQEMGAPVTASAGVVLLLDMLAARRVLPGPVGVELFTGQGWLEGQQMLAVALLNVLGLDRVEDVERLEADAGLCRLVRRYEKDLFGVGPRWFEMRFRIARPLAPRRHLGREVQGHVRCGEATPQGDPVRRPARDRRRRRSRRSHRAHHLPLEGLVEGRRTRRPRDPAAQAPAPTSQSLAPRDRRGDPTAPD